MAKDGAGIPAVLRKPLLEWIESDDGNSPTPAQPVISARLAELHATVVTPADDLREPITPPPGLRLAPLG